MKIDYNAPVVLSFTLFCLLVQIINHTLLPSLTDTFFTVRGLFSFANPLDYLRVFTHSAGHSGFQHLLGNSFILLLLGPILEEKYGSEKLGFVMIITTVATALVNIILFDSGVRGASGIVFAFIVLASIVNVKKGTIPLTFILIFCIHVGGEIMNTLKADHISQSAHIIGGVVGAVLGFLMVKEKKGGV